VIEEHFSEGDSVIHNIDPRVRVICAIVYAVIIAITGKLTIALCGLSAGILLILLARLSAKHVLRRLLIVNMFIVMLWVILPFSIVGETVMKIGPFAASEQGILYTLMLTIKCNAIVLVSIGLLSTCGIFNLVHALDHLRVPNKIIHLLFFIFRYALVMQHEYARLRNTLKIRGFRPTTSIHTYKTYASVVGTLLIRGYERSEQVHKAMVCRGFKGHYWLLDHFSMEKSDLQAACIMALGAVLLLMLQWKIV
jgi:cobalt/nickel transport system permease protein